MAHYAKVVNGIVAQVIVAESDFFDDFVDASPGEWVQTSYNTHGGKHYDPNTGLEDDKPPLRKNYAGEGFIYDKKLDVFYEPQPYSSWILNTDTYLWSSPIPYPTDGKMYNWDESSITWVEVTEKE